MQTTKIGFKRTYAGTSIPVFQLDKGFDLVQGGFVLDITGLANGTILYRGTPLVYDEAARTAVCLPVAKIHANATNSATTYQIEKGSNLLVGQNFAVTSGGAAYAITAIDTSNSAYDVVTVGTTLGVAVTAGQFAFGSTATGATAAVFPAINGLLYEETVVTVGYQHGCSAVKRATVYARRVPYSSQLAALTGLSHIIYSQSY
jgi:hypothetical protein